MKGQTMAAIAAVEAHLGANGRLPLNVKFLIEGSEEIGSRNLRELIREQRERLACDCCLNVDSGLSSPEVPEIKYALRGNARMDLTVLGPRADVHSGTFGGTIHNPAQALCELIAGMHDEHGRITLPGFYDRVRALEPGEREELARLARDERHFLEATGVPALWGEPGFTPYERTTARPTVELTAIEAGPTGGGAMSIVPARARASFLMRLVPDQDPEECRQSMLRYLEAHAPADIGWELKYVAGVRASLFDRRGPGVAALQRALQAAWGVPAAFARMGGSIGAVSHLHEEMGVATLLTGFGAPDSNIHGPNERLHIPTWRKGIAALTRFFAEAATG
jgi:acetylornithine deacetylase/succinyl-diaminopimelate desuccinylase-like protein